MNIKAAIIDHEMASLSEREIFACSQEQKEALYRRVSEHPDICGAVLLNTCNRTELYLSLKEDGAGTDPFAFLCESLDEKARAYETTAKKVQGDEVLSHLCVLTSGAASQLLGDSQIITQVSDALADAQEAEVTDANLNTVFRLGVTAGKKIRTEMDLQIKDTSTADLAVKEISRTVSVKKVLVVGNGTIGRLVAEKLARKGYSVILTLRHYHHKEAIIPDGVSAVSYDLRYVAMEDCDAVISTTASPHFVIQKEDIARLKSVPKLMIDMAVPRDIDPNVSEIAGVTVLNIDDISDGPTERLKQEQVEKLDSYIQEYTEELHRWEEQRLKKEAEIERLISPERDRGERRYFPLFIDSMDRQAVVIGGGNIAERRILTLAEFGFRIRVVSGSLSVTLKRLVDAGVVEWRQGKVCCDLSLDEVTKDAWMVLACTNNRDINREVGNFCKEKGLLINVCDARNESTFWFPAVGLSDELTMGLVGTGNDHMNVKKAAASLRDVIEKKTYK